MKRGVFCLVSLLTLYCHAVKAATFEEAMALYASGQFEQAVQVFLPLAEKGNAAAQDNLGQMYQQGEGVVQDYQTAIKWYRLSAQLGNAVAQYHLGQMYEQGLGIGQNYVRAHMWYNLAAAQNINVAKSNRDYLAQQMTPEQIAEAQALARECKAAHYKNCD
jgi:TPR repeat protein